MRLIRITTNYPAYLARFYGDRPGLAKEPYAAQYGALMADGFGWADFWTRAFGALGYEVWEPVGNAEPMQKAWARERGAVYGERSWQDDIVAAQVKTFRPDVVFVNDPSTYGAEVFRRLRADCPSTRLVIGWCGAPYTDGRVFREYDLVLSNIPSFVSRFRKEGLRSERVRHAFEPSLVERAGSRGGRPEAFTFLGSIVKRAGFHNRREALLAALVRETDLRIYADAARPADSERHSVARAQRRYDLVQAAAAVPGMRPLLAAIPRIGYYARMDRRPDLSRYVDDAVAARTEPALFGIPMYRKLAESRVTLNTHIDAAADHASNMRLFEATGMGACLLTERQPDLGELFEPDVEVAAYGSIGEAVEKVRYLLSHEEARARIAAAGQARTLRDHTFAHRAREIDGLIRRCLAS